MVTLSGNAWCLLGTDSEVRESSLEVCVRMCRHLLLGTPGAWGWSHTSSLLVCRFEPGRYRPRGPSSGYFVVVQSLNCVWLFVTPWPAARQLPFFSTISRSSLKFMSIESVMLSNHLILCHPLLLLPSVFPSILAFSNELALRIRWPKYWSFSVSIRPSNEYSGLISFRMDWLDRLAV